MERLLKQISANAAIASKHGDKLDSFTRVGSRLSYATHASELMGAKEAIKAMGADFRQLQELRPVALPWQQAAIDRMEPVLVGLRFEDASAGGGRLLALSDKLGTESQPAWNCRFIAIIESLRGTAPSY